MNPYKIEPITEVAKEYRLSMLNWCYKQQETAVLSPKRKSFPQVREKWYRHQVVGTDRLFVEPAEVNERLARWAKHFSPTHSAIQLICPSGTSERKFSLTNRQVFVPAHVMCMGAAGTIATGESTERLEEGVVCSFNPSVPFSLNGGTEGLFWLLVWKFKADFISPPTVISSPLDLGAISL